ncbi:Putative YALI0B18282p [Rhizopus microsporus]|nr:Putative YALI0B18282p [Rhizopus microsporus]
MVSNLTFLFVGIKRWTDGLLWSPSRILGNFLVYRELVNREQRKSLAPSNGLAIDQRERALIGSLTASNTPYNFKENGLIKKTIRMPVNGNFLHIVSYYNKDDVLNHVLPTPSTSPLFSNIRISPDLMPHLQGYSNHSLLLSASVIQAKTRMQNDELCLRKRSISSSSSSDDNNDSSHSNHRKRISLPRPFDLPLIDLQQTDMLYSPITKCHQNSILHPYYT